MTGLSPAPIPAATRSLPEQIADLVTADILARRLTPGSRIAEQGLADRFGVSRGPVREALKILEQNGLVINRPRVSARVRDFSADTLAELLEIRAALLCVGVRFAAAKANTDDVERLRELLAPMPGDKAGSADRTVDEFYRKEYLMFDAVLRIAHSRDLSALLRQITGGGVLHVHLLGEGGKRLLGARLRGRRRSWVSVIAAIAAGDADAAERAVRQLVATVNRALIQAMAAREVAVGLHRRKRVRA